MNDSNICLRFSTESVGVLDRIRWIGPEENRFNEANELRAFEQELRFD